MKNILFTISIVALISFTACNSNTATTNNNADTVVSEYKLVWSDEFQYKGLPDSTKWWFETEGNSWGWGNNELQHYTDKRIENAYVDGEMLHIKALKEKWENKSYTSARLLTKGKGDWLYGKVEVKAKLASGRGSWPAIWMLPTDWAYGGWPASGEIDIMEHVGYEPDSVYATAHTKSYNHTIGTQKSKGRIVKNPYTEFHIYTLEWEAKEYRVYMDGELFFTFKNEGTGPNEWPFDKRFYLLLNVAVGGGWGGKKGVDENIFPSEMTVDYVRVYQK